MSKSHSVSELAELRRLVDGHGGSVAVVTGVTGPFQAGVRRAPVDTLLEAILAVMADTRIYERVALFTARGDHLPSKLTFSSLEGFQIGSTAGGWLFHGSKPTPNSVAEPTLQAPAKSATSPFQPKVKQWVKPKDRVLYIQSDSDWVAEIEKTLSQLESLLGLSWVGGRYEDEASPPRSLVLVDEMILRPRSKHLQSPGNVPDRLRIQLQERLCSLPRLARQKKVDLVMFARNANTSSSLKAGMMLQDDVRTFLGAQYPTLQPTESFFEHQPLTSAFPSIGWNEFASINLRSVTENPPYGKFLPDAKPKSSLLEALKVTPLRYASPMDELNSMIGISAVKQQLESFIILAEITAKRLKDGIPCEPLNLNTAFYGNPGTGKTEVARILGTAIGDLRLLSGNKFTVASSGDFIGKYIGESRQKAKKACQEAMGGILFIDEAYDFIPGLGNEFADEAVTELLIWMNNYPKDIAFILAGYPDKMDELFRTGNPGLKRRVPHKIVFSDYDDLALVEISKAMCKRKYYVLAQECTAAIVSKLKEIRDLRTKEKLPFGNAGEVKSLLEKAILNQMTRLRDHTEQTLQAIDFLSVEIT